MEVELEVKRIGNSLGVIIPKKVAETLKLAPGEKIIIKIEKKTPRRLYGILKGVKLDPEKAKVFREDEKW
ncbi:MAG: hypothetical protein DRJ35_08655 [Thermoprotei archaeon]|nr:MAG: hypothetical protein DRJ35_08655 [Thermoprotei archaeon]